MTYAERKAALERELEAVNDAILKVLGGQSYSIAGRSVTRANLTELRKLRNELQAELDELESTGSTRRKFKRRLALPRRLT